MITIWAFPYVSFYCFFPKNAIVHCELASKKTKYPVPASALNLPGCVAGSSSSKRHAILNVVSAQE